MSGSRSWAAVLATSLLPWSGCAPSLPAARLPSMSASPPTDLRLGWDRAQTFHVPPPVVLTAGELTAPLDRWPGRYFTDWPVTLPDGRAARVDVSPIDGEPHFDGLRVYRPGGSLQLREWDNLGGLPNAPGLWTYYGPDGKTPRATVDATHLPGMRVSLYDAQGRLTRIFDADAHEGVVLLEYAVSPNGALTAVNGDPREYFGIRHPSPPVIPFALGADPR